MGRRLLCIAGLTMGTLMLVGCATMRVSSHTDRGLVWTKYHTFDWGPRDALPVGDARLDKNPFFQDRVEGAIEKAMAAHGFTRSAATERPDVLIHYHASITERVEIEEADHGYGQCATGDCRPHVTRYEAGTLLVDIVDAATNVLIWRGWAQDHADGVLGKHDGQRRRIDDSVGRMFATLPPLRSLVGTAKGEPRWTGRAPLRVNSYLERGVDFAGYRSYAWAPQNERSTGDPRLDNNRFFRQRVEEAVDMQLAARGFHKAGAGTADLLIHVHAYVDQRFDGTLLLDLIDRRTNSLAWRGWAEDGFDGVIDDQRFMEATIDTAVARILARLPRT